MALSKQSKQEMIQRFLVTKQKAHNLEIDLRFKGKSEDADKVAKKTAELSGKIDALLVSVIDNWLGRKDVIIQGIKEANTSLQKSIRQIQNDVETAKNIERAIGYIDDVVVIAAKIASAIS